MAYRPPPAQPKGLWRAMPPAIFPSVLGLLGLGLAWRVGVREFGLPQGIGDAILGAVTLLAVFCLVAYAGKALRRPSVVFDDMRSLPGRGGVAAGVMAVHALALGLAAFAPIVAQTLLVFGLGLHLIVIGLMIRLVLSRPGDPARLSPVWHLIFVGPVVGALAALALGHIGVAIGLSALTAAFSVAIYVASAWQAMRERTPPPLRPLLAIHLAPMALHGQVAFALGYGTVAQVLAVLCLGGIVALVLGARWLTETGFSGFWGSFTFSLAATAVFWLVLGDTWRIPGGLLLIAISAIIPWIAVRVLKTWANGQLSLKSNAAIA